MPVASLCLCVKSRCPDKSDLLQKPDVMHRHGLVVSLRCCFICRCSDKPDRIGVETYAVFHCADVSSIETDLKIFDDTAAQ